MDITGKKIYDSPKGWIADHIEQYLGTNGKRGHEWRKDVYSLLITTKGRVTGKLHRTGLIYGRDDDRYIIVASNGGRPNHPNWYLNLNESPEAHIQVKDEKFYVRAYESEGEERQRLWEKMVSIFPQYADYKEKTDRKIPVIILEKLEK